MPEVGVEVGVAVFVVEQADSVRALTASRAINEILIREVGIRYSLVGMSEEGCGQY